MRLSRLIVLFVLIISYGISQEWRQLGSDIDGEAANDASGWAVAISADGNRVAISAINNDGTASGAGHVRVYEELNRLWVQVGSDIDGEAASDYFGKFVSLSSDGKRVAIGASHNNGNGANSGHARIYEESGGVWTQIGSDIDGEAASDHLEVVSLSSDGKRVALGAVTNNGNGSLSGHTRIFEESGGIWTQIGSDIDGEAANDYSGLVSISADGKRIVIGATGNDGNGTDSGHARVFEESGGMWTQIGSDIDGEAAGDHFGGSVSISADGKRVAIGATLNDGNETESGHVRIFEELGGVWTQVGSDIDGEATGDHFGGSVSISADGKRVAIGADENNINGTNSGHVRIFEESSEVWTQVGSDIDGDDEHDHFGRSVSISADGKRIVVGADGGNADYSGYTRIFSEHPECVSGSIIYNSESSKFNFCEDGIWVEK